MQEFIRGTGSIHQLPGLLAERGVASVFLITGKHWPASTTAPLFQGINVKHYQKNGVNVDESEIETVLNDFLSSPAGVLIVIGGGSVMDLGKGLMFRLLETNRSLPYFMAVPTTAGSGAEATGFAVVYRHQKKHSIVHEKLLPSLVLLDPELTYSLSPMLTAISGMDVLAQAVESYWSRNADDKSRGYARESIDYWKKSFIPAVKFPTPSSRTDLQWAAYLAGRAIQRTRTTGPHALSYYLTAQHGVPHGQAVGMLLPLFFRYNNPGAELCSLLGVDHATAAAEWTTQQLIEAGLAVTLNDLGLDKQTIAAAMLDDVNEERFANNPVPFDRKKLLELIDQYL